MAKKIPPVLGYNFKEIDLTFDSSNFADFFYVDKLHLQTAKEDYKNKESRTERGNTRATVNNFFDSTFFDLVNEDACATRNQIYYLINDALTQIEEKLGGYCINGAFDASERLNIAHIANSFRLDCANCLNGKCKRRDPACPVSEVEKRVAKE